MISSEQALIDMILRHSPLNCTSVRIGPGDDAAVLGDRTTVTVDTLVEGVHFDERLSPSDIGYKAVTVSVSDTLSMGALPTWFVLSVSVPPLTSDAEIAALAAGVGAASKEYGAALVGGDTTRSPSWVISVTMGGTAPARPWTRSGARPGDMLLVVGRLGLASAGYLLPNPPIEALEALRRPHPPLAFVRATRDYDLVRAAMDVSDGLAADLPRLCAASRVGARVTQIPVDPAIADQPDLALTGGEDYTLLLAAAPESFPKLRTLASQTGMQLHPIGVIEEEPGIRLEPTAIPGLTRWPAPAFQHFPGHR